MVAQRLATFQKMTQTFIAKDFFLRHNYTPNKPCMENKLLEAIIRFLHLNVEIRGNIPNEEITIGFEHDSIKNYFLITAILQECFQENGNFPILSEKLMVNDVFLIKFIVEVVKENPKFQERLRFIVFLSKSQEKHKEKDGRRIVADKCYFHSSCCKLQFHWS